MNSWFDYGFAPVQFASAVPGSFDPRTMGMLTPQQAFAFPGVPSYAGSYQGVPYGPQPTNVPTLTYVVPPAHLAANVRQPFFPSGIIGSGFTAPYGLGAIQAPWQVLPTFGDVANQGAPFQPSPFARPIGFQPPGVVGGTLSQPQLSRIPTDEEIEHLISEALDSDPFLPATAEVEIRAESGQVTLTGTVPHKQTKHAIGELAWNVPGIVDVQNNLEVASRRRIRAGLRKEAAQAGQQRK
jgi:hypothetical protein